MSKCAYCDIESKTNLTNCVKCDDLFCKRCIESLDCGHVCSICLEEQVEDELDKKELIVDEKVKYMGGHSQYPASTPYKTQLMLYDDCMYIEELRIKVNYSSISNVESMDRERISKLRVVGLGVIFLPLAILGAFWKKKQRYTVIQYRDENTNMDQTMIFDCGNNVDEIQFMLYDLMVKYSKRDKKRAS